MLGGFIELEDVWTDGLKVFIKNDILKSLDLENNLLIDTLEDDRLNKRNTELTLIVN